MFTGSTEVARLIQASLAERLGAGRRADPADRRDRRAERADRRFLRARRAGRRRRARLRFRFGGPALLGAARALPAGRHRRPHAGDAEGGDARAQGRAARPAVDRRRAGDFRRGARRLAGAMSRQMRANGFSRPSSRSGPDCARRHFLAPTLIEIVLARDLSAKCSGRCCTCCATSAKRCTR